MLSKLSQFFLTVLILSSVISILTLSPYSKYFNFNFQFCNYHFFLFNGFYLVAEIFNFFMCFMFKRIYNCLLEHLH